MSSTDFASAQERVAARRAARQAAERARLPAHARPSTSTARIIQQRLPAPVSRAFEYLQPHWDVIKGREGTKPAFRVGQVDAELLDEELIELLRGQVGDALKYFGAHLKDDWSAETLLALRAILFKLTIWDHDASYGASLQNLKYTDARVPGLGRNPPSRSQKALYGLLSVGGRYAWNKWEDYLLDVGGSYDEPSPTIRRLASLSSYAFSAYSFAAFASFLVFLLHGKYRTVLDRLLRLRLTSTTAHVTKEVSFEYLNRQLVWHAFTEFLLFLLPLVGISRWKKWIARAWRRLKMAVRQSKDEEEEEMKDAGELGFLPERTCAICYQDQNPIGAPGGEAAETLGANSGIMGSSQTDITNPYETVPCGCKYCFVCLAQRIEAEDGDGWACLRCGEIVRQCKPWSGDVIEEKIRRGSGKRVSFVVEEASAPPQHIQDVDPMPVEDNRTHGVELDAPLSPAQPLNESAQWADVDGEASENGSMSDSEEEENGVADEEDDEEGHAENHDVLQGF